MFGSRDVCNIPAPDRGSHYLPSPMRYVNSSILRLNALALILALIACGPEPTTPSDNSLAGTWSSANHVFTISSMRMQIVQEPRGIVSGQWSLRADDATEKSGSVIGTNTVAQVRIQLLGLGEFEGALIDTNTMRGVFAIAGHLESITFLRGTATTP